MNIDKPARLRGELPTKVNVRNLFDLKAQSLYDRQTAMNRKQLAEDALAKANKHVSMVNETYRKIIRPILEELLTKVVGKYRYLQNIEGQLTMTAYEKAGGWWSINAVSYIDPLRRFPTVKVEEDFEWFLSTDGEWVLVDGSSRIADFVKQTPLADILINVITGETSVSRSNQQ